MDDSHGKEIDLQKTTIKIPGSNKPRIGRSLIPVDTNRINNEINSLNINGNYNIDNKNNLYEEQTPTNSLHTPLPGRNSIKLSLL